MAGGPNLKLTAFLIDYLIWDNDGGLSGFLNKPGGRGEVPIYIDQGGSKQIADGVHQPPGSLRLADMDGYVQ